MQTNKRALKRSYRGFLRQIPVYLGRFLRMFIYQQNWIVLPIATLIAGIVAVAVRNRFYQTMEGTLIGAFALAVVCIWNGCFNSIQTIYREKEILRQEWRNGFRWSAYLLAQLLYQAFLCLIEVAITLYVLQSLGVTIPEKGFVTSSMYFDLGITLFLMTYAADMLGFFLSSIVRSTTIAMMLLPVILVFQLIFSDTLLQFPAWGQGLSKVTISNYGIKSVAALGDYNQLPMTTGWTLLNKVRDRDIDVTLSVGQVLDYLKDDQNTFLQELREREIGATMTVGELFDMVKNTGTYQQLIHTQIEPSISVGEIVQYLQNSEALKPLMDKNLRIMKLGDLFNMITSFIMESDLSDARLGYTFTLSEIMEKIHFDDIIRHYQDEQIQASITVGEALDLLCQNPDVCAHRDQSFTIQITIGALIDMAGEDRVKTLVEESTAAVSRVAAYERTYEHIYTYWTQLGLLILIFAGLSTISLIITRYRRS